MSNQSPFGGRGRVPLPSVPRGEVIASYETYPQAQQAVDVLARADFPVDKVSIVGSDLKTVERVTGKLTWGRVALAGAASGAWLGVFFGLLLVIFSPATNLGFILAAVLIGAGFGMLFGLVSYAITRSRRDYTSMTQVLATSYAVIVDPELVNRARNLIAGGGQQPAAGATERPVQQHPSDPPPAQPEPPEHLEPSQAEPAESETRAPDSTQASPSQERPRYGERDDSGREG
ncbi:MAG TPA: general stress protein [Humibacter sp.]|nr:general stress protein [Humibacter sp.]